MLGVDLEANLRRRVFDVLEDLATAYVDHAPNGIREGDHNELYETCLIFLYRLLFVLYAESRGLLPVRAHGFGHSKTYLQRFAFVTLAERLRRPGEFAEAAFFDLYEQLLALFRLINGDNPEQNEACRVTRYNGGLFRPHVRIDAWRIPNAPLAAVLRQLVFAQPPARPGERQQRIATDETVDYASLHVRQLGDIYEGLLGGQLVREGPRLRLKDESGRNRRDGIIYTPDWIVEFLVVRTLDPLLEELDRSPEVQRARQAETDERRRDNSFAYGVLRLNLVDPAMGSGHFLVRATEWLAERILDHPTTRHMTARIVATGEDRLTRAEIAAAGLHPVAPGIPQEDAERAFWRRRIVECCIYGVDLNPLAVELAKLSLWLTCIAADEPLSFLDHHLQHGNSLLYAAPEEMNTLPSVPAEGNEKVDDLGGHLPAVLASAIGGNVFIEARASTELELVKAKEQAWKRAQAELRPFVALADVWVRHLAKPHLTWLDWRGLLQLASAPRELASADRKHSETVRDGLDAEMASVRRELSPFHWRLAFPDVFYGDDGQPLPSEQAGFDAVLGNPPYVSTHTSSGQEWRASLERRDGYVDDLYVHFTGLGFRLLRDGGRFGFIVSDTFFTLASKARMRETLQRHRLEILGQCDPFDVTVDAAIFVAAKVPASTDDRTRFIQARPRRDRDGQLTRPDLDLPRLPPAAKLDWSAATTPVSPDAATEGTRHAAFGSLRLHDAPSALWASAHKRAFFEPRPGTLALFRRFNEPVKRLTDAWWPRIETSDKFAANRQDLAAYHDTLKPGDITLVGLVAEGGQGMRTANNARFLGYLEGTPQARAILAKREKWTAGWLAHARVGPRFRELLREHGGNLERPLDDGAAWEACVEPLRAEFSAALLGFGKTDLYRVVPAALLATEADFAFAWERRKQELWERWRKDKGLAPFWAEAAELFSGGPTPDTRRKGISDTAFCTLCQRLLAWLAEQKRAGRKGNPRDTLGLRSSEAYGDPADAPRIAAIYNGFSGRGVFAPFRKGDPDGNRWTDNEPLFIDWSSESVEFLFTNSGRKGANMPVVRNPDLFFVLGFSWTRGANHVPIKVRITDGIIDANALKLRTVNSRLLAPETLLATMNAAAFSFILKRFLAHTWMAQITDLRMMPFVMPTPGQERTLRQLADLALAAKRLSLTGQAATQELAAAGREWTERLLAEAPTYLRPSAQTRTLQAAEDCLAVFELAVDWQTERLYGVEGAGPFDEF